MLNENKLDSRTVNNYFIGHSKRSRGYKFYDPKLNSILRQEQPHSFKTLSLGGGGRIRLETLF